MRINDRTTLCRLAGHTLLEMLLSLVLLSIVMASVGSAVMFASQAIPDEESPVGSLLADSAVLSRIAEDIASAQYIIEQTGHAVTVVVPDRTGDAIPDRLRYAWSGTYGEPLFFQLNDKSASIVIDSVATFSLAYLVEAVSSLMPTATYFAAESTIDSYATTGSGSDQAIKTNEPYGQVVTPGLSSDSLGFMPTRISLYSSNKPPTDGQFLLELRDRTSSTPGSTVYGTNTSFETALPDAKDWNSFTMSQPQFVASDEDISLVFTHLYGNNEVIQIAQNSASGGQLNSSNGGSTWTTNLGKTFLYQVFGRELLPAPEVYTATQQHLTITSISLQRVATGRKPLTRNVRMLLAPPALTSFSETGFDVSPTTMDLDADGSPDWTHSAGTFPTGSLSSGLWNGDGQLTFKPAGLSNADVISITARMRSNDTPGPTIYGPYTINSGGELLPIITELREDGAGGQELVIYNDTTMTSAFTVIPGLPSGLIDIKLTVIPDEDYLYIQVNHKPAAALLLERVPDPGTVDQAVSFGSAGGVAEFDSINIRIGGSYSTDVRTDVGGIIPGVLDLLF